MGEIREVLAIGVNDRRESRDFGEMRGNATKSTR